MRITKVDIPEINNGVNSKDYGLCPIRMDKLSNVVLIAGKNGAGKTRIITKIFEVLKNKPISTVVKNAPLQIKQYEKNLDVHRKRIQTIEQSLIDNTDMHQVGNLTSELEDQKKYSENNLKLIAEQQALLDWKQIETSEMANQYSSVYFVPKTLILQDNNNIPKNQLLQFAANISAVGINHLHNGVFAKIQVVQDRWFNATHPNTSISQDEKLVAISEYEKLKGLIKTFLSTNLNRDLNGEPTLFNFPIGKSMLSDGQIILLQFCLAIFSQETSMKDLILVLDEPENHLHPSVIIETIERIQECVANGQIWIATHSIPLLAHFDPAQIWYVENSQIEHAGKIPEKVLHSLLGDESEVSKLQDFISLPSQFATSRYAFECLFQPSVVSTNSNDPQSFQIRADLLKLSSNRTLRILDYGAGKGRLISNIVDLDENTQEKLISNIDYIAYDKFSNDKELCEANLIKAFGASDKRYYNDMGKLLTDFDKCSFDIVIMCNVLHEIDPKEWLKLFHANGTISNILNENGILLLVEDHQIPVGEKAYQKGFLVLDTPQIKELFKIKETDKDFSYTDQKDDGRLKAHKIPKRLLTQIDAESRLEAIKSMSRAAREKILEIRDAEVSYKNGKLHGFWTQQFANSQLNIDEFATI
ncbi:AAA family ATPase [Flavobacterium sp. ZB4P13]|uniref:AAA family ATPase n=1 Tax=Flavobacterium sp. ZB4P13 TaxID=3401728 RepID=UPI003AADB87C